MQSSLTKTIASQHEQNVMDVPQKNSLRGAGRKATITQEELFQATLNLIGPEKSISSLSLREIAREAGIAPNSFYRHFKDIDELAIALINRAGLVLRQIIREARLQANQKKSVIRSSVEIFLQQLDTDEGNLSLLLREGYTGSSSYKKAVEQQLTNFQHELQDDLIRLGRLNKENIEYADIVAKAITQLVFNMGAKVLDLSIAERQVIAEETMLMIRMIMEGAKQISQRDKSLDI
ncbi:HTH-type transcriptional repressor FabR [Acinetobacter qingfengensis]|nr:HTH-type transcriptional repressor FabR [Acinetobacter qingfengensis]KAA8731719.1 HTH-type transcriptional repressor FabR [Acinetobacter qingfengensis]